MAPPKDRLERGQVSRMTSTLFEPPLVPNERTALLTIPNEPDYSDQSTEPYDEYDSTETDANEFDNVLARVESRCPGLGVEPSSQETAMLRGPRIYQANSLSRKSSYATLSRNRSRTESTRGDNSIVDDESDQRQEKKTPFLAGVSVARFWLIFSGTLILYFVACFDSTIMVSTHPLGKPELVLTVMADPCGENGREISFHRPVGLVSCPYLLKSPTTNFC